VLATWTIPVQKVRGLGEIFTPVLAAWHIRSQNDRLRLPDPYFSLTRNSIERHGERVPLAVPKRILHQARKTGASLQDALREAMLVQG
jgi:hypothetical protein